MLIRTQRAISRYRGPNNAKKARAPTMSIVRFAVRSSQCIFLPTTRFGVAAAPPPPGGMWRATGPCAVESERNITISFERGALLPQR